MAFRQIKTPAIADSAVTNAKVDETVFTGQTAVTSLGDLTNDLLLVYDSSNTALKKITFTNFVTNSITTADLTEDTNLFYTQARVQSEIDSFLSGGGTGVTYTAGGTIDIDRLLLQLTM